MPLGPQVHVVYLGADEQGMGWNPSSKAWAPSASTGLIGAWTYGKEVVSGQVTAVATGPMFSSNYLARKDMYQGQAWLIWTNVAMDAGLALSCAVIFVCIWWAALKMRGLPRLRAYVWILSSFGSYILVSGITRLMGIVTIWWPVYPVATAVKGVCAAASLAAAVVLVRATPLISQNLKALVEESSTAQVARQTAEDKLLKSEENFRLILLSVDGVGIWEWDLRRSLIVSNDTYARFHGIDPELMVAGVTAERITRTLPPADRPAVTAAATECVRTGRPFCVEHRVKQPDGSLRWVELRGDCKYGEDGTPQSLAGVMIDISARKRNEENLRLIERQKFDAVQALLVSNREAEEVRTEAALVVARMNERFRLLVEGVDDYALFTLDSDGTVTSWNRGAERLLGYTEGDMAGRHFSRLFTPEDIEDGVPERVLESARRQGRAEDEGWRVRSNGERFWATVTKTAFAREGGPTRGLSREFAVIIHDTTERKNVAMALEEARQARYRLQEDFLSHVSHELRTPLTAIYFFTSNVMDGIFGELTPDQRAHLAYSLENAEQLKAMVDDLLDITRVGSTRLSVHPHRVDCVRLVEDAIHSCLTNAHAKAINLRSEYPGTEYPGLKTDVGLPFAWADAHRVRQILINLIDNGIKFSPRETSISIAARVYGPDPGFVHLSVTDQGRGIAREDLERIFNRLAQVEGQSESSRCGLGLGLFITKELVGQHGGRIWVESEPGRGSTFHFTLPTFSLTRLCAHVLTRPNLARGCVALLSIDLTGYEGAWADIQPRVQTTIEGCIHPAQDVLLNISGNRSAAITLFVVGFTDGPGSDLVARRLEEELKRIDVSSRLNPVVTSTAVALDRNLCADATVDCAELPAVQGAMAQFERVIQAHLEEMESVK